MARKVTPGAGGRLGKVCDPAPPDIGRWPCDCQGKTGRDPPVAAAVCARVRRPFDGQSFWRALQRTRFRAFSLALRRFLEGFQVAAQALGQYISALTTGKDISDTFLGEWEKGRV